MLSRWSRKKGVTPLQDHPCHRLRTTCLLSSRGPGVRLLYLPWPFSERLGCRRPLLQDLYFRPSSLLFENLSWARRLLTLGNLSRPHPENGNSVQLTQP